MPYADPEKRKAYIAEYLKAHRESIQARKVEYRRANKESIQTYMAEYYKVNRQSLRAQQTEHYEAHREQFLLMASEYRKSHRESIQTYMAEYYKVNRQSILAQQAEHYEYISGPRLDDLRARLVYVMDEVFHTDAQRRRFVHALIDRGYTRSPSIRSVLHHRGFDEDYIAPFYVEPAPHFAA